MATDSQGSTFVFASATYTVTSVTVTPGGDLLGVPYDRVFSVRYSARLADVPSSVAGAVVTNRAQTVWDNVNKPDDPTSPSYPWTNAGPVVTADTRIVEPSVTIATR